MNLDNLESTFIQTNGITLHVMQAGPKDGPLLILLHGFPEFWYSWKNQIEPLAEAGYRVWAPDMRGYNLSDKPRGISAYNLDLLAADVVGLMDQAGVDQARLVGHDWGAAVAWWTAANYPDRLSKLGILNVPHHSVMAKHLRTNREQRRRSWYIYIFQLPWLPERGARRDNYGTFINAIQGRNGRSEEENDLYRAAWSQPGALTSMINYYRALIRHRPKRSTAERSGADRPVSNRIRVPTLMIWGAQDVALGREMAQPSIDLCDEGRLVFLEEATHWVQHDEPERVNDLLLEFLA